jgi:hypothetical protein
MDVETPTRGKDRTEGFAPEKRRTFHKGTLTEPYLGGLCPLHGNVGLGRPMTSPSMTITSSNIVDVLGDSYGSSGTCGSLEKPKEGISVDVQDHTRRTSTILDRYTWEDD